MSQAIKGVLTGLAVGILTAFAASLPASARTSLDDALAESGYRLGEAVERVPNFRIDGWQRVDARHIVVFDDASRGYLVTFEYPCNGLGGKQVVAWPRSPGILAPRDEFRVQHEGRTADRCHVDALHRLEPVRSG